MIAIYRCGMLLTLCLGSSVCAGAHPFHVSDAEVEYDPPTDRVQVSLKLQALDLERALTKSVGAKVNIERVEAEKHIADYLSKRFYITNAPTEPAERPERGNGTEQANERRSKLHLVGQELKGAWLWLYFELELPQPRTELRLVNTILFDENDRQINSIFVRFKSERASLKTTVEQPTAKFRTEWLKTQ